MEAGKSRQSRRFWEERQELFSDGKSRYLKYHATSLGFIEQRIVKPQLE
jgi:hypothetical protein